MSWPPVLLPAPATHVQEWAIWVAAVSAGLVALAAVARKVRAAWRVGVTRWHAWEARFDALNSLVQHELRPNTGSSLKDAVERVETRQERHLADAARVAGQIEQRLGRLEDVMGTAADAQAAMWPAIEAVAKAQPPDPEGDWPEDDRI